MVSESLLSFFQLSKPCTTNAKKLLPDVCDEINFLEAAEQQVKQKTDAVSYPRMIMTPISLKMTISL